MAATTASKPRNPPKLFSVSGTAEGVKTELSNQADAALDKARETLEALAAAPHVFPRAKKLARDIGFFMAQPTEPESEQPDEGDK